MESILLNGVKQSLLIRSYNIKNPVILYIHGGPGSPEMPLIRYFNKQLEQHFTVVCWEQRGAGKSFNRSVPASTFTIAQFVDDGYELSKYLAKRFNQEKIYIIGHSWGTIISTLLARNHPELFYAYIGVGQVVNAELSEKLSYKLVLEKAIESNHAKAIKELRQINTPDYLTIDHNNKWLKQLTIERKWVTFFGGSIRNQNNYNQFLRIIIKSPEYSIPDMIKYVRGSKSSLSLLWPEIMKTDFLNSIVQFEIPVYFFQGIYDFNCPAELINIYYPKIIAPKKELVLFNESAHNPGSEENEKFNEKVIELFTIQK